MKVFVLDSGLGQDISKWFAIEGNSVKHFIYEATYSADYVSMYYGKGLFEFYGIERVSSYFKDAISSNFVFVTDVNFGKIVDELKEYVPVFGANSEAERLESERDLPYKLFKEKLNFPNNYHFKKVNEAIKFLEENKDKLFAIKLDKLQSNVGKIDKTYVPYYYEDALYYLKIIENNNLDVEVNLQEKIEGVEAAVTGIFNGKNFLQPVFVNFEEKRAFPSKDGLGTGGLTGEAGTIMFVEYNGKFYNELLKPTEEYLSKIGYYGFFDWNTIISKKDGKAYILEATVRPGYPTIFLIYTFLDLNKKSFTEIIYDTLMGKNFEIPVFKDKIGICNRIFPYDVFCPCRDNEPFLIIGLKQFLMKYPEKYLHFISVFYDETKKQFFGIPHSGPILVVTSLANSLSEARKENLEKVDLIKIIPDGWYREDIGKRLYWQKDILLKYGWISDEIYKKFF